MHNTALRGNEQSDASRVCHNARRAEEPRSQSKGASIVGASELSSSFKAKKLSYIVTRCISQGGGVWGRQ
eukprot:3584446-Pleurochrysis_carterae.AAC.2